MGERTMRGRLFGFTVLTLCALAASGCVGRGQRDADRVIGAIVASRREAVRRSPSDYRAHFELANALVGLSGGQSRVHGRKEAARRMEEEAVREYQVAYRLNSRDAQVPLWLGNFYHLRGREAEARAAWQQAAALEGRYAIAARRKLAQYR
jgi:tetratricopeptide (TPR) repeat protein